MEVATKQDEQVVETKQDEQVQTKQDEQVKAEPIQDAAAAKVREAAPDSFEIPDGTGALGLGSQSGALGGGTQEVRGLPLSSTNLAPIGGRITANQTKEEDKVLVTS